MISIGVRRGKSGSMEAPILFGAFYLVQRILKDMIKAMNPPNQQIETIYVNYFDSIDESKTKALMAICSDIVAKQKPHTLYFLFSSMGGSVNAGITLYNFLRSLPVEIIMHNNG